MEQNGLQIRNQRTHISLEHYETSLHQTDAYFLLTSVTSLIKYVSVYVYRNTFVIEFALANIE